MANALSQKSSWNHPTQQHGSTADHSIEIDNHQVGQLPEPETRRHHTLLHHEESHWRPRDSHDSNRLERTTSGVDVKQAERDFAELSRELSSISRRISRTQSKGSAVRARDLEKATSTSDDTFDDAFDLELTLRGNKEADHAAGIKSKHIGKCGYNTISVVDAKRSN